MTARLDGSKYVLVNSDDLRLKVDGSIVAVRGGTCERVPASALPWLLEQGIIAPVPAAKEASSVKVRQ